MREDASVNIAASQSMAKLFFSVEKRKPRCPYKLQAVLPTLKAAHLNSWLHGLTFLRYSAVSPNDQLLASISC